VLKTDDDINALIKQMQERRFARLAEPKPKTKPVKIIKEPEIIKEPKEPEVIEPEIAKEIKIKEPKKPKIIIKIEKPKKISTSKFQDLYSQGYTDKMISKICDVRAKDVFEWRGETHRESNYNPSEIKNIVVKLEKVGKTRASFTLNAHFLKALGCRADDIVHLYMVDDVLQIKKVKN
jgi:hypothetical protein